jgi:arylsulfatase
VQIRADQLGVYGAGPTRGAPTPRIDKLASEGLRLTNMNMVAQCTPSRSSILTGRYAIRSGTHSVPFGLEDEACLAPVTWRCPRRLL